MRSGGGHYGPRVNEQIRVPEIRLVGDDGHQYGVVSIGEARRISNELGLDLVEVSPTAKPPVVKLVDYGKFKYMAQKKANESKKKQSVVVVKELQFRPNIEKHDLEVKVKKGQEFLEEGDKLKLVMQFRGREMAYQAAGMEKFRGIIQAVCNGPGTMAGELEAEPKFMGTKIIAMISPVKKKK